MGRVLIVVLAGLAMGGCSTPRLTDPPRSATEQLLLSTAADLALTGMKTSRLAGKRAFLDATQFEGTDKAYAAAAVGERLNESGALLAAERDKADVVVAIRAGALSIDRSEFLIGLPELTVPVPFGGQVTTPELAVFKKLSRTGIAKLGLHAYEQPTGRHVLSHDILSGQSYYNVWTILGLSFRTTNIPEKAPRSKWWPWGT